MAERRGVALMLVLWLVVILGMISAGVTTAARSVTGVADNLRARAAGRYAAESGVATATQLLRTRLSSYPDTGSRGDYLNSLESAESAIAETPLGDGRFTATFVDVNARLDINAATATQLATFFSFFAGAAEATAAANAIRAYIDSGDQSSDDLRRYTTSRADLSFPRMPVSRPLRTLETLRSIEGVPEGLVVAAVPYLTVDGDGRINSITASDTVLAAAAGSLEQAPTRVMIVARGWLAGHALTHEIQAVYAIEGNSVVLVRWRERDL